MEGQFRLNSRVTIGGDVESEPVKRGILRLYRDMEMTLVTLPENGEKEQAGRIRLKTVSMTSEEYRICVMGTNEMTLEAGGDLGFVYGLIEISRRFLGVLPFWFWNDQKFEKKREVLICPSEYTSVKKPVEYRGWFINDEVLLSHWDGGKDAEYPWEMAFEALLRCGGNVVIPGTDRNSKTYGDLASDMGLWLTHHHAEPLGAEMFLRAYPDKNPSFKENPTLFEKLWEEGVKRQKDKKVIWNLGFRGQGDTPFWAQDPMYNTPEKRGKLISDIIREQYELVKKYVPEPVCCTNLYGETMELYQQGHLDLPEDIIMIWADNGYGKMVSRRQWNHNPRVRAIPEEKLSCKSHGVYYHVSFYDLQAANVLTMLPNSMEFVEKELGEAYSHGIRKLWLINCSNIKPHVYPLDFTASLWNGKKQSPSVHLEKYLECYYPLSGPEAVKARKQCFQEYFKTVIPYGAREDEHAGEQFYNYVTRVLIYGWMKDGGNARCEELDWCVPASSFEEQIEWYGTLCLEGSKRFEKLLKVCEDAAADAGKLWEDSILLQVRIHTLCLRGVCHFVNAYRQYKKEEYLEAFWELGQAADWFRAGDSAMKACCHDKWKGFYDNDCQTDIKETAYRLRQLMGCVRNIGDGPYFYQWQREVIYAKEDQKILLLLNEENHLTDQELYLAMKEKRRVFGQ